MKARSAAWFKQHIQLNPDATPDRILREADPGEYPAVAEAWNDIITETPDIQITREITPDELHGIMRLHQSRRVREMVECAQIDSERFRQDASRQRNKAMELEPDAKKHRAQVEQMKANRQTGTESTKAKAEANRQEIRRLYLHYKAECPKWKKEALQRRVSEKHPRKRGFSKRVIQAATKDL